MSIKITKKKFAIPTTTMNVIIAGSRALVQVQKFSVPKLAELKIALEQVSLAPNTFLKATLTNQTIFILVKDFAEKEKERATSVKGQDCKDNTKYNCTSLEDKGHCFAARKNMGSICAQTCTMCSACK